jgi:AraC-like DNA-binding protein
MTELPEGLFFPMLQARPALPFEIESAQHFATTHELGFDSALWNRREEVVILQHTLAGRGRVCFEGRETDVHAGEAFLITTTPGHRYYLPDEADLWHFLSFTLRGAGALAWARSLIQRHGIRHRIPPEDAVIANLRTLFQRISREVMLDPYALSAEAYQLAMGLERVLTREGEAQARHPKIETAIAYIHRHYRQPLGLNDIAAKAQLSRFYLTRLFKAQTGTTVCDYLEQVRIQHARHLLLDPERSIADVAAWVGFAEQAYFANVFRRRVGQSPSAYRIKARRKQFPPSLPPSP